VCGRVRNVSSPTRREPRRLLLISRARVIWRQSPKARLAVADSKGQSPLGERNTATLAVSRATRKLPGGPACHRNSYRYLPISLLSGLASPPSGLGHSTVWGQTVNMDRGDAPTDVSGVSGEESAPSAPRFPQGDLSGVIVDGALKRLAAVRFPPLATGSVKISAMDKASRRKRERPASAERLAQPGMEGSSDRNDLPGVETDGLGDWRLRLATTLAADVPAAYPGGPSHKAGAPVYQSSMIATEEQSIIGFATPRSLTA
jgi:hypothetical protein